jgi:hypothetical protein
MFSVLEIFENESVMYEYLIEYSSQCQIFQVSGKTSWLEDLSSGLLRLFHKT